MYNKSFKSRKQLIIADAMKVIGLVTSMQEAKELEYIAKVCTLVNRIHYLAKVGKMRRLRGEK